MRRAVILIVALTVLSVGLSVWLDLSQRNTARGYMDSFGLVREALEQGKMDEAAQEQAYLHARWQHDAKWLNCLISHHHTRAVNTAMLELATALEQRWPDEALRALDRVMDALGDVASSDFASLENIL